MNAVEATAAAGATEATTNKTTITNLQELEPQRRPKAMASGRECRGTITNRSSTIRAASRRRSRCKCPRRPVIRLRRRRRWRPTCSGGWSSSSGGGSQQTSSGKCGSALSCGQWHRRSNSSAKGATTALVAAVVVTERVTRIRTPCNKSSRSNRSSNRSSPVPVNCTCRRSNHTVASSNNSNNCNSNNNSNNSCTSSNDSSSNNNSSNSSSSKRCKSCNTAKA